MSDQPIPLTQAELTQLENDTENGTTNIPAGYSDILADITAADQADDDTLSAASKFWYQNALAINTNNPTSTSNTFIRSVTATGFKWDGLPTPNIQSISNAIGLSVLQQVIKDDQIETVATLVSDDISVALNEFNQTIGGWGGSFYYWNLTYPISGGGVTSVGNAILNSNSDYEKFITANALATVAVLQQEGATLSSLSLIQQIKSITNVLGQTIYTAFTAQAPLEQENQIIGRVIGNLAGNNPAGNPNIVDGYERISLGSLGYFWFDPTFFIIASPLLTLQLNARMQIIINEQSNFAGTSQHTSIEPTDNGGYTQLADNGTSAPDTAVSFDQNGNEISDLTVNADGTFSDELFVAGSQAQIGTVSGNLNAGSTLSLQNLAGVSPGSPLSISPIGGMIASAEANSDNSVQLDLSLSVAGLPAAVVANLDNSSAVGLDPSTNFQSAVNFAPGGLNGDTEAISVANGLGIFNTQIGSAATAEVESTTSLASTLAEFTFASNRGTLKLEAPSAFDGTAFNFLPGDTIDLAGISATGATLGANNVLTVNESGGGSVTLQLDPNQNFSSIDFATVPDENSGTDILPLNQLIGFELESNLQPGVGTEIRTFNPATGAVTQIGFTPLSSGPDGIQPGASAAINGDLYFLTDNGAFYTVDVQTGQVTNTVTTTAHENFVADDLTGELVGIVGGQFGVTNPTTGTFTGLGSDGTDFGNLVFGAEAAVNGNFYVETPGFTLYTINVKTGAITNAVATTASNFVADDLTGELVGVNGGKFGVVNPATGSFTAVGSVDIRAVFFGSEAAANGIFYVEDSNAVLYSIDIATGQIINSASVAGGASGFVAEQVSVTCFVAGTCIATKAGKVPIETLATGDLVMNDNGTTSSIQWIGRRRVDCRHHPNPAAVWPVRVSADAFADQLPCRDLWLSPDHAVYVNDVLIPIKHLINGCTIMQEPRGEVTYYHVELEQHDVLLAEGLPVESYLDTGDRSNFDNDGAVVRLHPEFSASVWETKGCAPLVITGSILAAVRARLLQRAAKLASQSRPSIRTSCTV